MEGDDLVRRQVDARVELGDGRVVPRGDLALVDLREHLAAQLEVGPVEPGDVVVDHLSRDGQGDVLEARVLGDLGAGQVGVGGTDVDNAVGGVRNAGAGASARRRHFMLEYLLW